MIVYQVLNEFNNPAGWEHEDLCLFKTLRCAKAWIKYLKEGIDSTEKNYKIKKFVLLPYKKNIKCFCCKKVISGNAYDLEDVKLCFKCYNEFLKGIENREKEHLKCI